MPTSENSSSTRLRAASPETVGVQLDRLAHLVADGGHRIEARHRLLEDHADAGAAHRAHLRHGQREQIAAFEGDAAPGSMRPGFGTSRMMASADIDLPQPNSPTSASVSPAAIEKPTRSTTVTRRAPSPGKEMLRSSTVSRGVAHHTSLRVRGSMMSRMASAMMLTASTSVKSAAEAPARFHQMMGVRESSFRAWSIICPQLPSSPMPR